MAARPPTQVRRRGPGMSAARARSSGESTASARASSAVLVRGIRTPTHLPCSSARSNAMSDGHAPLIVPCRGPWYESRHAAGPRSDPRRRLGHALLARLAPAYPQAASCRSRADPDEPLIAATVRRLEPLVPPDRVWISTGTQPRRCDRSRRCRASRRAHVIAEPVARNTAPCIGWASATIARGDPDAIVAVLPADHFIGNEPAFRERARHRHPGRRGGMDRDDRHRPDATRDGLRLHRGRRGRVRRASIRSRGSSRSRRASAPRRSSPRATTSGTAGCSSSARA